MDLTIGDVLAVIAGVIATGFTLASILTSIALLFRTKAQAARDSLELRTGRTFFGGLLAVIGIGVVGLILANQANGLVKLVGWVFLIALFALALLGSAGLGLLLADRIQRLDRRARPLRALWRAYGLLVTAGFLPFVGWFIVFPLSLVFSLGAGVMALLPARSETVAVLAQAAPQEASAG